MTPSETSSEKNLLLVTSTFANELHVPKFINPKTYSLSSSNRIGGYNLCERTEFVPVSVNLLT
jgi:hypothetical protein